MTAKNSKIKALPARNDSKSNEMFEEVTPWDQPVDGGELLNDLVAIIHRYVVCDEATADAAALWIAATWCIDSLDIMPIANITAPQPNCGKSTMLELMAMFVRKPLKVDNITPSPLFRSIDKWKPTLLIDEVDTFLKQSHEMRGIINSAHKHNGFVMRTVGENFEPVKFSTFCAIALCGIGDIQKTLQSRSIRLELRRKLPSETVERLRSINTSTVRVLKSKLCRFSKDISDYFIHAPVQQIPGLSNRMQDNWEPLVIISKLSGDDWIKRAQRSAQDLSQSSEQLLSEDLGIQLLSGILNAFESTNAVRLPTRELINELCADEEAPWRTYNRGSEITARQLARMLKPFGIKSKDYRHGENVLVST